MKWPMHWPFFFYGRFDANQFGCCANKQICLFSYETGNNKDKGVCFKEE